MHWEAGSDARSKAGELCGATAFHAGQASAKAMPLGCVHSMNTVTRKGMAPYLLGKGQGILRTMPPLGPCKGASHDLRQIMIPPQKAGTG